MDAETAIVLPPGVHHPAPRVEAENPNANRGMILNETDLPDAVVEQAVETYIEENASMLGVNTGSHSFQHYRHDGGLLARRKFRTPANVFDEMILARDLAERDDDVGATLGLMAALAFGSGMRNTHSDEIVVALYDEVARNAGLDKVFKEMYRELLITGQCTTASVFTREEFQIMPPSGERSRTRSIAAPLIGVLPSEQIRVLDNDLFGTATLAYKPATALQLEWLMEYFSPRTSAGRKAEMRREDPVLTTMLTGEVPADELEDPTSFYADGSYAFSYGTKLYLLNKRMTHRTTFEKGAWKYPRPLMTRNFALLEAKRLLNIMDYALLQGGSNYIVVAKKGTDQRPAMPEEVTNLREVLRRATSTGVVVGDHRLSIEVITPELKELLNPEKRGLIGRKLAGGLLRLPDFLDAETTGEALASVEMLARVISSDRLDLRRHVENGPYEEVKKRNPTVNASAGIWFPQIVLQGLQYFTDLVLKLGDRGNISRRSVVEAGGFDYDAEVQARKREKAAGDDRVLTPPPVPFSSPNAGPQDNGPGRPNGTSPNNGSGAPSTQRTPPATARPSSTVTRNAGETVKAMHDEDEGYYRIGESTYAILEHFPERTVGRLTAAERRLVAFVDAGEWPGVMHDGPLTMVPVNDEYDLEDVKAIRLAPGVSMLMGYRVGDAAMLARAFVFREPEFSVLDAEEKALQWGFPVGLLEEETGS